MSLKNKPQQKTKGNNFVSLDSSKKVLSFYCWLLGNDKLFSVLIIFTGLLTRLLSVGLFMLIVKVFLSVVNPEASVELVNQILSQYVAYQVNTSTMLQLMISALTVLIFIQYLISKFNLKLFLSRRKKLIKFALGENVKQSNWQSFSRFPQTRMGVEQVLLTIFRELKNTKLVKKVENPIVRMRRWKLL